MNGVSKKSKDLWLKFGLGGEGSEWGREEREGTLKKKGGKKQKSDLEREKDGRRIRTTAEQQQKSQQEGQTEWWEAKAWVLEILIEILRNYI